ncbi:MAG: CocE/NonD family hydrolase [Candidatus Dormibacteraceae bacterium]
MAIDVPIPARDGITLATNIWRPCSPDRLPVLLVRTPYGKNDLGDDAVDPSLSALLEAGYAVAVQECRGTCRSLGVFEPHIKDAEGWRWRHCLAGAR